MADLVKDNTSLPDDPEVVHHETSDANIRAIFIFLGSFVVIMVAIYFLLFGIFRYLEARTERSQPAPMTRIDPQKARIPPEPRLQVLRSNPVVEMRKFREQEDAILNGYGVTDRNRGAVRIPIEEAMKLAARRPEMFPVRTAPAAGLATPSDAGTPTGTSATVPVAGAGLPMQEKPVDERKQLLRQVEAENQPQPQQ